MEVVAPSMIFPWKSCSLVVVISLPRLKVKEHMPHLSTGQHMELEWLLRSSAT